MAVEYPHTRLINNMDNPIKYIKMLKVGGTNRVTQDESQWIVAQRLLSALTIPGCY